jgi:lipoprotein-releasing system ATP-binding protein
MAALESEPTGGNGSPQPLLALQSLSKSYRTAEASVEILRSVDMALQAKDTIAVVGASGIGKSTLLYMLGALDRPDAGALLFNGQDVLQFEDDRLARFRNESIGFVFQFHHLLPEFTALENVMMPGLINGWSRQRCQAASEDILLRVGLRDRLSYRVVRLSGGEQQRVALARALVMKPAVLLADEPTGNLDRRNSQQVHELMLELNREMNMTLVVVTHNLELAAGLSRRVTLIDGKISDAA